MFNILGRITELIKKHGWSLQELSKKTGISQDVLEKWCAEHTEPPIEDIEKVCKAFGISLSEFFSASPAVSSETRLAIKRKESGLSQEELAKKAKISVETICAYEQGKRDIEKAQYRIVRDLAKALDCRMEEIV